MNNDQNKPKFWKKSAIWAQLKKIKHRLKRQQQLPRQGEVFDNVSRILQSSAGNPQVAVITPTTGSPYLAKAIESIQKQAFQDVVQLIVVDGIEFEEKVQAIVKEFDSAKYRLLTLPYNTGKNGMNGHRIYAALPFLINSEYVFFLDEDNWLNKEHVSSIVTIIQQKSLDWAYSFRKIYTQNGEYVCDDHCESLGVYPSYSGHSYLIDTNCFGFRRAALVKAAAHWYHPLGADRYFFHYLKKVAPNYRSTGKSTTNYRLSADRHPQPDFFKEGNRYMQHVYDDKLPWLDRPHDT